ncbi:hypothetical protein [Burkholderia ubonensis]|uniref:hypothetical protein n=1 Tax=Burkholderia ubonensis TaxID=101571 RepID=UPI000AD159DC|nr:hypothetical protein [Burkholderia ubonensis]
MTISYQLISGSTTVLRSDGMYIPADPANADYEAYLAWVGAGNAPVPASMPTTAQLWQAHQTLAMAALIDSDRTVLRCYENGVPMPAEWSAYRKALRAIVGAASGDPTQPLPTRPAYPAGT